MSLNDDYVFCLFPVRLKMLLEQKDITQTHLAKGIGISRPTISKYLAGDHQPELMPAYRMAKYLGVSIEWLLGVDQDITTTSQLQLEQEFADIATRYRRASQEDRRRIRKILSKYKDPEDRVLSSGSGDSAGPGGSRKNGDGAPGEQIENQTRKGGG